MTAVSSPTYRQRLGLRQRWKLLLGLFILSSACLLVLYSPINLALAHVLWPQPDGILVLGGQPHREGAAARLAKLQPDLPNQRLKRLLNQD